MSCWEHIRKNLELENLRLQNEIKRLEAIIDVNYCYIHAILDHIKKADAAEYLDVMKNTSLKARGKFMEELEKLPEDQQEKIMKALDPECPDVTICNHCFKKDECDQANIL